MSRLLTGAGAAYAWGALPDFSAVYEHAVQQVNSHQTTFVFFTPDEAQQMESVCEQIIPSDDGPGAREAGAVFFIDYALGRAEPYLQPVFRDGLKLLAHKSAPQKFTELSREQKIAVLQKLESTEFFQRAREYTILGFLGNPKRHGNRGEVGWKYIGFDSAGMFSPPFGYYDAELLSQRKQSE